MFGRIIPAILLVAGVVAFACGLMFGEDVLGWMILPVTFFAFVFPGLLIWSYFLGPQRGRFVHFLQIAAYFLFSINFLVYSQGLISNLVFDLIVVTLLVGLGYFASLNYNSIRTDYKLGIKNDFFKS